MEQTKQEEGEGRGYCTGVASRGDISLYTGMVCHGQSATTEVAAQTRKGDTMVPLLARARALAVREARGGIVHQASRGEGRGRRGRDGGVADTPLEKQKEGGGEMLGLKKKERMRRKRGRKWRISFCSILDGRKV